MLAVSKNHELVELCITVFKEVTNSPVWNVINDQVHKSVSNNVLYVEQLVAGMHKPDKSAPTEPSVRPIKAKSLSKADIEDFLTNIEKSSEEEPAPCTHSHRKGKEKTPAKTEKRVKDPKDSADPHKCHLHWWTQTWLWPIWPKMSTVWRFMIMPTLNLLIKVSADRAPFLLALETLHGLRLTRFPKGLVWQAILPAMEASIHHLFHSIMLISFISGATDEGSLFHTVEELQQELLLLPFGSMEAKSTLTLMSLYNAATAALTSHLFSVHKALQDYKDTLVTCNEISRILCDCHVTLLSPQAYDTKDVDMPMVQ
ncbi:hypothetical protein Moror_16710 [Moniliophthora roreri MCA 2997]|uniref:Uncharacterized protein n=1 Tax=Moniliophthora roreri (strain MCA 2997) TaxID=1381753 RepID=V2XPE1_MONRO|nr:hypothetical protein Moror_16710 [Moniliophthora roreri MCA 2997]